LIPGWLQRGGGHFVSVASAAGLLTQVGAAGYAVTKHAAVGFAEWLSITYGDNGIGVTCVCPMGVDTPLLTDIRESSDPVARLAADAVTTAGEVLTADDVAASVLAGVRDNRFLVLPHAEVLEMYRGKGADYERWITGMRRYQRALGRPTTSSSQS
jgi:NAD(P)-dependent dehydrogenase (short-subunit alcohol dehydrogenase family)